MNRKGFTLIELLAVIIILIILFALAFYSVNRYLRVGRSKTLKSDIKTVETAAKTLIGECIKSKDCGDNIPEIGEEFPLPLSYIVQSGYLEDIQSPYDGSICTGNVYITRLQPNDVTTEYSFKYRVCLKCGSNKQAAVDMAKYMIDDGATNQQIMDCVPLGSNEIDALR